LQECKKTVFFVNFTTVSKDDLSSIIFEREIAELIKQEIGSIVKPDKIYIASDLPKTRSGKIMRRILKKIIAQENDLGDISTLINPEIVDVLSKIIE